jgi:hypothetical protein
MFGHERHHAAAPRNVMLNMSSSRATQLTSAVGTMQVMASTPVDELPQQSPSSRPFGIDSKRIQLWPRTASAPAFRQEDEWIGDGSAGSSVMDGGWPARQIARMCVMVVRPAEHSIHAVQLPSRPSNHYGLLDMTIRITSKGSGYPMYTLCGFRVLFY